MVEDSLPIPLTEFNELHEIMAYVLMNRDYWNASQIVCVTIASQLHEAQTEVYLFRCDTCAFVVGRDTKI